MTSKPYYIIDFLAANCFIDIRVNDVSVFSSNLEGQLDTGMPINYAILGAGEQRVNYTVLPLLGETQLKETAYFSAAICLYDGNGDTIVKLEELDQYTTPQEKTGIIPLYRHETVFNAPVPYHIEAWQNSTDLKDMDVKTLRTMVENEFKKIERMFDSYQYMRFMDMIAKKEADTATSMYLTDNNKKERANSLLKLLQTGFKVVPPSPEDLLMFYGYGKLVALKNKDGHSAFLLKDNTGQNLYIDLKFHLPKGSNELMII